MVCFSVCPDLFVSLCAIFIFLTKSSVFYYTVCFFITFECYISASIFYGIIYVSLFCFYFIFVYICFLLLMLSLSIKSYYR